MEAEGSDDENVLRQAIHRELQRIVTPSGHSRQYDQMSLDIRWAIWNLAALSRPPTPPCGLSALAGITSIEQLLKTEFAMTPPGSSKRKRSKLRPGVFSRDFNGSNVPLPLLPAGSAGPCSTPQAAAHCFLLRFTQQLPLPELQQQQAAVGEVIMFQPALDCLPKEFQEVVGAAAAGAAAGSPLLHPLCVNQDHNWMFQPNRKLWVNDSVMYGVVEVLQAGMLSARKGAAAARRRRHQKLSGAAASLQTVDEAAAAAMAAGAGVALAVSYSCMAQTAAPPPPPATATATAAWMASTEAVPPAAPAAFPALQSCWSASPAALPAEPHTEELPAEPHTEELSAEPHTEELRLARMSCVCNAAAAGAARATQSPADVFGWQAAVGLQSANGAAQQLGQNTPCGLPTTAAATLAAPVATSALAAGQVLRAAGMPLPGAVLGLELQDLQGVLENPDRHTAAAAAGPGMMQPTAADTMGSAVTGVPEEDLQADCVLTVMGESGMFQHSQRRAARSGGLPGQLEDPGDEPFRQFLLDEVLSPPVPARQEAAAVGANGAATPPAAAAPLPRGSDSDDDTDGPATVQAAHVLQAASALGKYAATAVRRSGSELVAAGDEGLLDGSARGRSEAARPGPFGPQQLCSSGVRCQCDINEDEGLGLFLSCVSRDTFTCCLDSLQHGQIAAEPVAATHPETMADPKCYGSWF